MATINLGAIRYNWKGAWSSSTAYVINDVVSNGGNSYVSIQAGTNQAVGNATAYWNIMSSAGTNGTDLSSTLTTRGDLLFRNASTLARLAKGTNGYFLKQGANDPEWGAVDLTALSASNLTSGTIPNARYGTPTFNGSNLTNLPGGGKVLQLVSTSDATVYSAAPGGSTFIEPLTSLRAVITPSATSSKIYVMLTLPLAGGDAGNVASGQLAFDTAGGSANVIVPPNSGHQVDGEYAHFPLPLLGTSYDAHSTAYSVLHSPGTTSALTYKFRAKSEATSGDLYINRTIRDSTSFDPRTVATITAMEIGA